MFIDLFIYMYRLIFIYRPTEATQKRPADNSDTLDPAPPAVPTPVEIH